MPIHFYWSCMKSFIAYSYFQMSNKLCLWIKCVFFDRTLTVTAPPVVRPWVTSSPSAGTRCWSVYTVSLWPAWMAEAADSRARRSCMRSTKEWEPSMFRTSSQLFSEISTLLSFCTLTQLFVEVALLRRSSLGGTRKAAHLNWDFCFLRSYFFLCILMFNANSCNFLPGFQIPAQATICWPQQNWSLWEGGKSICECNKK